MDNHEGSHAALRGLSRAGDGVRVAAKLAGAGTGPASGLTGGSGGLLRMASGVRGVGRSVKERVCGAANAPVFARGFEGSVGPGAESCLAG